MLPFAKAAVGAFGWDRLCFEANWFFSNWPDTGPGVVGKGELDGYGEWVRVLVPMLQKELGAGEAELKKVFRTNAKRVYGIKEN